MEAQTVPGSRPPKLWLPGHFFLITGCARAMVPRGGRKIPSGRLAPPSASASAPVGTADASACGATSRVRPIPRVRIDGSSLRDVPQTPCGDRASAQWRYVEGQDHRPSSPLPGVPRSPSPRCLPCSRPGRSSPRRPTPISAASWRCRRELHAQAEADTGHPLPRPFGGLPDGRAVACSRARRTTGARVPRHAVRDAVTAGHVTCRSLGA